MKQTEKGKAFEYALALQLSKVLNAPLIASTAENAKRCYEICHESKSMDSAAHEAALFLAVYESKLESTTSISLQSDRVGQLGDVRDILLSTPTGDIGISAKNNHQAVKHSRLSYKLDFGKVWADCPVSRQYWDAITPTFDQMAELRDEGIMFRDVPDKAARFYLPVLIAFEDEFRRLCESFGQHFISRVFRYLIGKHDFYKVIRQSKQRYVHIQPFNLDGTLSWGQRWTIPSQIELIRRPQGSNSKILINFEGGWQLLFRIHNARSKVEPSLKFDIKFEGIAAYAAGNQIPLPN